MQTQATTEYDSDNDAIPSLEHPDSTQITISITHMLLTDPVVRIVLSRTPSPSPDTTPLYSRYRGY